jgi:2-iminobutanoate/2-iminopropanoate deaminase
MLRQADDPDRFRSPGGSCMAEPIVFANIDGIASDGAFSHLTLASGFAFLAGQIETDDATRPRPSGDIALETKAAMDNLARILAKAGLGFEDVVRTNLYMTDLTEFQRMNSVYAGYFAHGKLPARTTVGVAQLLDGCRIEIDCIARLRSL